MKQTKTLTLINLSKKVSLIVSILIFISVLTGCGFSDRCHFCDARFAERVYLSQLIASSLNTEVDKVTSKAPYMGTILFQSHYFLCEKHKQSLSEFVPENKELFLLNMAPWENGYITVDEIIMDEHQFSVTISFEGDDIPASFTDAVIGLRFKRRKVTTNVSGDIVVDETFSTVSEPEIFNNTTGNQKRFVYDRLDSVVIPDNLSDDGYYPYAIYIGKESASPSQNITIGTLLDDPNGVYFFLRDVWDTDNEIISIRGKADY